MHSAVAVTIVTARVVMYAGEKTRTPPTVRHKRAVPPSRHGAAGVQFGESTGPEPEIGTDTGGAPSGRTGSDDACVRRRKLAPARCATLLRSAGGLRSRSTARVNCRVVLVIRQVTTAKAIETIPRPMWISRKESELVLMIMLRINTTHTQAVQMTDARSRSDARRLMAPWYDARADLNARASRDEGGN